jgi:hypothetical protein
MELVVQQQGLQGGEMKPLQQILAEADQQKVAIGHFNISDLVALMEAPHTRRNRGT